MVFFMPVPAVIYVIVFVTPLHGVAVGRESVDFNRHIRPIFSEYDVIVAHPFDATLHAGAGVLTTWSLVR
jgi:hypothetical protein